MGKIGLIMLYPRWMRKFNKQRIERGDIFHPTASDFLGIDLYLSPGESI
jgi:hypothetical protein